MITVNAIKCRKCKTIVYSRAQHDYRACQCGDIAIDGGREYTKLSFNKFMPVIKRIEIDATEKQLFDDWNNYGTKYGFIKK